MEFSAQQMKVIQRLLEAGMRPIAIPPYESALCMHRGELATLLAPVENGGLRLLASPTYLVDGNLSVKISRGGREVFVWKQKEMEATAEKLKELGEFREELEGILGESVGNG